MMKLTKTITALALSTIALSAIAQKALNDVRLSPQGVNLALVGHATLVVPNDHAKLLWTVQSQAATLQEATAATIGKMNAGIETIKTVSLDAKLKTMNVNSYPVYSNSQAGVAPQVIAWRVSQTVSLDTDDVSLVPQFISAVNGKLELDNLSFSVTEKTRASQEQELIRLAIANATQKAAYSAEAMGLRANRVQLKDLVFEGADSVASNHVLMCEGITDHWGFAANDICFKSVPTLIDTLLDCRKFHCNLLLNVGPTADGTLTVIETEPLKYMGRWVKMHERMVYDAVPADITAENADIYVDGDDYYAVIRKVPMCFNANVTRMEDYKIVKLATDKKIVDAVWADDDSPIELMDGQTFKTQPYPYGASYFARVAKFKLQ